MTVAVVVANPAQTLSLNMLQEQPTQTLALNIAGGVVNLARQPRSAADMLLDESGVAMDFMLDIYIVKS